MICEWNEYSLASGTSEDNMLRYNLKHEWEGKKKSLPPGGPVCCLTDLRHRKKNVN